VARRLDCEEQHFDLAEEMVSSQLRGHRLRGLL
jgi:hypothetical protein